MNENRDKPAIFNNKESTKLAKAFIKTTHPSKEIYEKKRCAKNKTRLQKAKRKPANQTNIRRYFQAPSNFDTIITCADH